MGNSQASQIINEKLQLLFTGLNQTTQNCITNAYQSQSLSVTCAGCTKVNITLSNVSYAQEAGYTTDCSEAVTNLTNLSQMINNQVTATAQAIEQAFSLSSAQSSQVLNLVTSIGDNITNQTVQNCLQSNTETQGLAIVCPSGANSSCNITVDGVKFSERFNPINNCLLTTENNTALVQQLIQAVTATSSATVQSFLGPLIWIGVLILLVVGVTVLGGTKVLTNPLFLIGIAVLIGLYFVVAYFEKWIPFEKAS